MGRTSKILKMKISILFFSFFGVMTFVGMFVFYLNGWYLGTITHTVKVINTNVLFPQTVGEILNKVESPTISSIKTIKLTAVVAKNSTEAPNEVMGKAKNERPMCSEKGSKLGMYFVQEMFHHFLYQALDMYFVPS